MSRGWVVHRMVDDRPGSPFADVMAALRRHFGGMVGGRCVPTFDSVRVWWPAGSSVTVGRVLPVVEGCLQRLGLPLLGVVASSCGVSFRYGDGL